jgi:hypothetical protein
MGGATAQTIPTKTHGPPPDSVHPSTRRKAYDDELPFLYAFDLIELKRRRRAAA